MAYYVLYNIFWQKILAYFPANITDEVDESLSYLIDMRNKNGDIVIIIENIKDIYSQEAIDKCKETIRRVL